MQQLRVIDKENDRRRAYAHLRCVIDLQTLAVMRLWRVHELCVHDDLIEDVGLDAQCSIVMYLIDERQQLIDALALQGRYEDDRRIGQI